MAARGVAPAKLVSVSVDLWTLASLAACHSQRWICRRLKAAAFHGDSRVAAKLFLHARLVPGEDPCWL
jgi:hypothetical protein